MKIVKILNVLFLLAIFIFSISLLAGGSVIVKSKGRGTTIFHDNGDWEGKCDNANDNPCTYTIILPDN
jgi:hypothetical protein